MPPAFAYADVVNEELCELIAAGADIVQLDEPYSAGAAGARARGDPGELERHSPHCARH